MNSGNKTEVDSGNQISDSELSDAELDQVTGGDVSGGSEPLSQQTITKVLTGFSIGGNATIENQVGNAMGVAGGATKPKPA